MCKYVLSVSKNTHINTKSRDDFGDTDVDLRMTLKAVVGHCGVRCPRTKDITAIRVLDIRMLSDKICSYEL